MEEHRSSTSSTSGTNTRPPGVTQEDQDVSKALEASLMESNKRRRSQDTGNPEDRKRANGVSASFISVLLIPITYVYQVPYIFVKDVMHFNEYCYETICHFAKD